MLEIKHKYLHLFHRSLAEFNTLFPEERSFFGLTMDLNKPEKTVEKMHVVVRQRHEHVSALMDAYQSGSIPLAMMARMTGGEPIDAWYGLLGKGAAFDVCLGIEPERNQALRLLKYSSRILCFAF